MAEEEYPVKFPKTFVLYFCNKKYLPSCHIYVNESTMGSVRFSTRTGNVTRMAKLEHMRPDLIRIDVNS